MKEIRICWLTENYPPQRGGMAQSCDRIVDGLRKMFTIDIVHFTNRTGAIKQTQQIKGHYISIPFEESEAHTLNVTWNFLQYHTYDLLVCFGGYLPVLAAPIYTKWMQIPLLTLLRGNDFDASIFTPRKRDILKDALLASQQVCVVSKDKQQKIKLLFPEANVGYVPNGIDVTAWKPSPSEVTMAKQWRMEHVQGKICLGVFGQLKTKKGLDTMLRSLLSLEVKQSTHLLLVGDIAEGVLDALQQGGISFSHYPFMDRYELISYYLCCEGVVIPSYYDGMPNVLLEACALGIPVLASRVDGMKDVIHEVASELLFNPGNEKECSLVFSTFLNASKEQKNRWSTLMEMRIKAEFTHEQETKAYEKVIDALLGSNDRTLRLQSW